MPLKTQKTPSIQMTLFDYFMDSEQFTLKEAIETVKQVKEVKDASIRGRIYEGIDNGIFERVAKGVYTVKRKNLDGKENVCMVVQGNGRDLSFIADNSIDALITDHPYKLDKSLKGGNRDFANYESFQYTQKDMDEKFRVLKEGCFLVEFLPEENSDNYKYIYQIKEMAEKAGLEYYSSVPWKKGEFVANTGRKAKNTEQVVLFTKGKARSLKLDMKKIGKDIEKPVVITYHNYTPDTTVNNCNEPDAYNNYKDGITVELHLIVSAKDKTRVLKTLDTAWNNWLSGDYDISIGNYLIEWLSKTGINFFDVDSQEFNKKDYFMSGTNGMLPTVFDVSPVEKKEKIHQAEKPLELLEQIIEFVSKPNEKILDQFAGSGVVGEAALNKGRDSVLIEKNEETYRKIVHRMNKHR